MESIRKNIKFLTWKNFWYDESLAFLYNIDIRNRNDNKNDYISFQNHNEYDDFENWDIIILTILILIKVYV